MNKGSTIQSPATGIYKEIGNPIKVGDHVVVGHTLCFVDSLPVQAIINGTVTIVFLQDRNDAKIGDQLFEIEPK